MAGDEHRDLSEGQYRDVTEARYVEAGAGVD